MNQEPLFVGSFREDGRRFKENRSIEIKMGVVKESSGSCLFNLGETTVIAWIKGPCETNTNYIFRRLYGRIYYLFHNSEGWKTG